MKELMLCNHPVRVDDQGYFCLTDIWKGLGSANKIRPKYFFENDKTQEYVRHLEKGGNPPFYIAKGRKGGTYAHRKLCYEFAGWAKTEYKDFVYELLDSYYIGNLITKDQWLMQQELQEHVLKIRVSEQIGSFHGKGLSIRKKEKHQLESKSDILLEKYQYQLEKYQYQLEFIPA